jgi:hypothetical protein
MLKINKPKRNIENFLSSGDYIPKVMRDFHFQKNLFKTISEIPKGNRSIKSPTWKEAHCYVIDRFLWFMAKRGYTLQRSRASCEFRDLEKDIEEAIEHRTKQAFGILDRDCNKNPTPAWRESDECRAATIYKHSVRRGEGVIKEGE